jgi:hypothetical protein
MHPNQSAAMRQRVLDHVSLIKLQEAGVQARRYGAALQSRYGLTDLHLFAVALDLKPHPGAPLAAECDTRK